MSKFKVGDWVYFSEGMMDGEVETLNEDGTYNVAWEEGNNGGRMTVTEDDMELGETPDYRRIPEMNEREFNESSTKILRLMMRQYPMCSGDLQTVAMFSKMFKDEYLKEYR